MRMYGYELVEALHLQQTAIDCNGTPVIVKVNPEEERPGYLDPREIEAQKYGYQYDAEMAKENPLQAARDSMGFPNRNLNTVEIHTKYECLNFGGNEVGLWRYYPRKPERKKGRPCLMYIHGGGWVGGSVYTLEHQCRLIAELADAVVFNIDYSLAPEKKFPNGFDDCFNALKHIYDHADDYGIDNTKITVAGDSAGGNLAAALALKDRDLNTHMIAGQVLVYPCVTFVSRGLEGYRWDIDEFTMSDEHRSRIEPVLGLGRPRADDDDDHTENTYVESPADLRNPYVSPALSESKGLPPAVCIGAEFDGLRIQTEFYARKLAAAGVPVKTIRYKGCTHAFFDKLGFLPQAEDVCMEIANAMQQQL